MKKKKEYFFYKNTKEYFFIRLCLLISCLITIALTTIKIYNVYICKEWDLISGLLLSLSTGYIISCFYFYLITYSEHKEKERRAAWIIYSTGKLFIQVQERMEANYPNNIRCEFVTLYETLSVLANRLEQYGDAYSYYMQLVVLSKTYGQCRSFPAEKTWEWMSALTASYHNILDSFEDKNEVVQYIEDNFN